MYSSFCEKKFTLSSKHGPSEKKRRESVAPVRASVGWANPVWSGSASALRARPPVWGHSIHAPDGGCTRGNTTTARWDQNGKMASQRALRINSACCDLVWQRRKGKAIWSGGPVRSGSGFDWNHPAEPPVDPLWPLLDVRETETSQSHVPEAVAVAR